MIKCEQSLNIYKYPASINRVGQSRTKKESDRVYFAYSDQTGLFWIWWYLWFFWKKVMLGENKSRNLLYSGNSKRARVVGGGWFRRKVAVWGIGRYCQVLFLVRHSGRLITVERQENIQLISSKDHSCYYFENKLWYTILECRDHLGLFWE